MPTHKVITQYVTEEGIVSQGTDVVTSGDTVLSFEGPCAVSVSTEIDLAFQYSKVKAFSIFSDAALTLKTNSSGAPVNTIPIAAGQLIAWSTNSPMACLFTTSDITKLFATNASGTVIANLKIRILLDTTP